MHILRNAQLAILEHAWTASFFDDQARQLFPAAEDRAGSAAALARAARQLQAYGIGAPSDLTRFFRLAKERQVEAELLAVAPDTQAILADPFISSPARRLARLASKLAAADALAQRNAVLEADFFARQGGGDRG